MRRILILFFVLIPSLYGQDVKYVEYDTDLIPGSVHKERRAKVMAEIGNDAVAFFYAASMRTRNADVEYQYRQDDNFLYLTGFPEPNAVLALIPKGLQVTDPADSTKMITVREILFVHPKDPLREHWNGRVYGPVGAMKLRGLEYALPVDQFERMYSSMVFRTGARTVYVPPFASDFTGDIAETMQPLQNTIDQTRIRHVGIEFRDPTSLVYNLRAIKGPEEIALIAKASEITALAHRQAMMSTEPGMFEYQLAGVYEYVYRAKGAEYNAYPCIVGAAENSVVLHYNGVRRRINGGDLILADCGAEYHGYATDVTRTWPANGKFSAPQREIYEIVLRAQKAAMAMMRPGVSWSDISAKSGEILEDGLFRLGLIKEKNQREYRRFATHGLGHSVGLNVHDISRAVMEPGVIYTVEPGIYIQEGAEGVDPKYFNIGVRIEDTVLVTKDGPRNLSESAPREIADIEALMKKKGVGNFHLD
ncbi:MAG: aminopeptidase P N-terminal domain-containing protein [Bacteroidota bacterium]